MKAYKGFNKDMTCRGFQFKEGETYTEDRAELCRSGFHACLDPIDCLNYYDANESVYREVEMSDVSEERNDDSKIVAKKITIGGVINFLGMAKAHVEYVISNLKQDKKKSAHNDENYSAATNTGNRSAATNTGNRSAATVSGMGSVAISIGYESKVKGAIGCAIVCVERGEWNRETCPILSICSAVVDGKTIKADTFYTVKNGVFVEAE